MKKKFGESSNKTLSFVFMIDFEMILFNLKELKHHANI